MAVYRATAVLATSLVLTPTLAFCGVGIAMVPYMKGVKDDTADWMYELAGSLPNVKRVYVPVDAADFFDKLPKIAKINGPILDLIIMGHGDYANPQIQFSKGGILPHDVDIDGLRGERKVYQEAAAKKRSQHDDPSVPDAEVKRLTDRIQILEMLSTSMAPGAHVVLINCSAAATPKGVAFVKNLGWALLHKNGGVIVASKGLVTIKVQRNMVGMYLHRALEGEWADTGDMLVKGDWEQFPIPAQ